ncbi:hypothetical protein ACFVS2_24630 [Brevibacillus sp. NPDC058079]|uniref:hypothetical protein n=1 Tax=Brevibacillus sp. NPDC058079 TaxID=3346330 RepID=UPI0036E18252
MNKIRNSFVTALSALVLCLAVVPTFAMAEQKVELSKSSGSSLKNSMNKLNIDIQTQDELINKLQNGQMLDSENPKELSKVPEDALTPSLDDPVKRYTFPDGSVIENGIEIISKTEFDKDGNVLAEYNKGNAGEIGTLSSEEIIKSKCGSGYCIYTLKVYHDRAGVEAYFMATVNIINGGADKITSVGDYYIYTLYGSSSNENLDINRGTELEGSAPAAATLKFTWSAVGSSTMKLRLNVENDSYYSSASW